MPNAVELANLLAGPALEWAMSIANYDALEPMLARRIDRLGGYPESLACCLFLNGKKEECLKFMAEYLAKYPDWKQHVEPIFGPLKGLIENKSSMRFGDIV